MAWEGSVDPADGPAPEDKDVNTYDTSLSVDACTSLYSCTKADAGDKDSACSDSSSDNSTDNKQNSTDTAQKDTTNGTKQRRIALEVMPSNTQTLFATAIVNILTEGLTAVQENLLGNFLTALGALTLVKAARDDISEKNSAAADPTADCVIAYNGNFDSES